MAVHGKERDTCRLFQIVNVRERRRLSLICRRVVVITSSTPFDDGHHHRRCGVVIKKTRRETPNKRAFSVHREGVLIILLLFPPLSIYTPRFISIFFISVQLMSLCRQRLQEEERKNTRDNVPIGGRCAGGQPRLNFYLLYFIFFFVSFFLVKYIFFFSSLHLNLCGRSGRRRRRRFSSIKWNGLLIEKCIKLFIKNVYIYTISTLQGLSECV